MSRPVVIVVGLGAVGSATALHLVRAGAAVVGFDRWRPPHRWGSTHGESRITRATAWEGTQYVPLVARAQQLWADFSRETGRPYFAATGGLFVGHPHEYHVAGTLRSAHEALLRHELLERAALRQRWPWLDVPDGMVGVLDPGAGVLSPERIVEDQLAAAAAGAAALHFDCEVRGIEELSGGVRVSTSLGVHHADAAVICAGGWTAELLGAQAPQLRVERVTQHWFAPASGSGAFSINALRGDGVPSAPVLLLSDGHDHATAVFPERSGRIKVAGHGTGVIGDVQGLDREVRAEDVAGAERILRQYLPSQAGPHLESSSCFYTRTPNGHFVIDRVPGAARMVYASACNGFGFKFSVAVGEALAAMALGHRPPVDVSPWQSVSG